MIRLLTYLLLFIPAAAMSQFSFVRAAEHFSFGTAAGFANTQALKAHKSATIEFNTALDFGLTTVNLLLVGRNFKNWKAKTPKQKRRAFINSAAYIGIGLGARQLTINYAKGFNRN